MRGETIGRTDPHPSTPKPSPSITYRIPIAPLTHEHRWQAVAFLEAARSVIQSCECGEARRVEVP